jgi:hypothetical protein
MAWRVMKDFLEGEEDLKVAVPKSQGPNYIFSKDSPVFATAPGPIEHPTKPHETSHMTSRMRCFVFCHWFDPADCPNIKPCVKCCADWLLAASLRARAAPGPPPRGLFAEFGKVVCQQECSTELRRRGPDRWVVEKPAGSYTESDLLGRCFCCGESGHYVDHCPGLGSSAAAVPQPVAGVGPQTSGRRSLLY